MTQKFKGSGLATGYWGSFGPDRRIAAAQVPESLRVLEEDKLIARGKLVTLFIPVSDSTPGVVPCTCVKDTSKAADQPCLTCYGVKLAPGFLKFFHQTLFWASAEQVNSNAFVLTNVVPDFTIKPNRLLLADGAVSGTIITNDKPFTNPVAAPSDWVAHLDAAVRSPGATVTAEFSTNYGVNYYPISQVNTVPFQPVGSGVLRLRITMTRTATTVKSPAFEIARLRRVMAENVNIRLVKQKRFYQAGQIIVARTQVMEQLAMDAQRGVQRNHLQDRGWTSPLDLFDISLTHDTPPCRIDEGTGVGPHPFYEYADGVLQGTRYPIENLAFNEQLGLFTQQAWSDHRAQTGEVYNLVF